MCSVVILFRPGHDWPVLLAANRDEMADRPWAPPARHWPDRPEVVAGLDRLAGGSWLGINDHGVLAGILNRVNSLGPLPGRRSRGELVLEALRALDPGAYRSFNMVIADARDAWWLRNLGHSQGWIDVHPLPPGLSMITAHDRNDPASRRIRRFLPRFEAAPPPDPDAAGGEGDWAAWEELLASRDYEEGGGPTDAMAIVTGTGFETVSSSLVALPAAGSGRRPVWRFAAGRAGERPFEPVAL